MRSAPRAQGRRSAFTLIELLAVLLIMGLVAGLTLPNLSLRSERVVLGEAQQLAADLAFTRQRAVATGTPHRVVVDLDNAGWWIEAWPEEAGPFAPVAAAPDGMQEIQLVAPPSGVGEPQPLAGPFGHPHPLPDGVAFESVETPATSGPAAKGQVEIVFDGDGTADPALFVLANESGDVVRLQLSRLADEIRITRD
jgi:type II secretion system protein H